MHSGQRGRGRSRGSVAHAEVERLCEADYSVWGLGVRQRCWSVAWPGWRLQTHTTIGPLPCTFPWAFLMLSLAVIFAVRRRPLTERLWSLVSSPVRGSSDSKPDHHRALSMVERVSSCEDSE